MVLQQHLHQLVTLIADMSTQYDITGVGSTMCRHSVVAQLLDISTGERYIYACVMLYMLLVVARLHILVVWYDINCRFGVYFLKWAFTQPALAAIEFLTRLKFPLPCFHRYSHRWCLLRSALPVALPCCPPLPCCLPLPTSLPTFLPPPMFYCCLPPLTPVVLLHTVLPVRRSTMVFS